jgi:hypothetical protein
VGGSDGKRWKVGLERQAGSLMSNQRTMNRWSATSLVLAMNLSLSSLFAQSTNPAAVKLPPQNDARHNLFLQRIAQNNGAGDVIFLGDSITEQWDESFTANHALWKQHFGAFNPVNLGVGAIKRDMFCGASAPSKVKVGSWSTSIPRWRSS